MPKTKDLKLDQYDIGQALYRELLWFCLQYGEKKMKLRTVYGLRAVSYDKVGGRSSGLSDPTARTAEIAEIYRNDIDMIDYCAKAVCPYQTKLFLRTVTERHTTYTTIRMQGFKMSQGEFNRRRRHFYYLLAERLRKI